MQITKRELSYSKFTLISVFLTNFYLSSCNGLTLSFIVLVCQLFSFIRNATIFCQNNYALLHSDDDDDDEQLKATKSKRIEDLYL